MQARYQSRAPSVTCGHLRISRFARRTTEKRETARSLSIAWPGRFKAYEQWKSSLLWLMVKFHNTSDWFQNGCNNNNNNDNNNSQCSSQFRQCSWEMHSLIWMHESNNLWVADFLSLVPTDTTQSLIRWEKNCLNAEVHATRTVYLTGYSRRISNQRDAVAIRHLKSEIKQNWVQAGLGPRADLL